jgi:hypothetical protein
MSVHQPKSVSSSRLSGLSAGASVARVAKGQVR